MNYDWGAVDHGAYQVGQPRGITTTGADVIIVDEAVHVPYDSGYTWMPPRRTHSILVAHTNKDGTVDIAVSNTKPKWRKDEESLCHCGADVPIHLTLELMNGAPPVVVSWSPIKWWSTHWPTLLTSGVPLHSPAYQLCEKLKKPLLVWLCVAKRIGIPRDVTLMVCEWVINTNSCIYTSVTSHLLATDVTLPTDIPVMIFHKRHPPIRLTAEGFGEGTLWLPEWFYRPNVYTGCEIVNYGVTTTNDQEVD